MISFIPVPIAIVLVGIVGMIVGSFMNVVLSRMNTGRTIMWGRSHCMTCGHTLHWYDLIPMMSFLIMCGRCRYCHARISAVYIVGEVLTAMVWIASWLVFGWSLSWVLAVGIGTLLVALSIYDVRHKIIPDIFTLIIVVFSVIWVIVNVHTTFFLSHALAAVLLPLPFFILWWISGGRWFGLGDVKLMIAIGLVLGGWFGLGAIIAAFWIAMVCIIMAVVLAMMLRRSIIPASREIPFGPFLALAFFLELLHLHVFESILQLFIS